MKRHMSRASDGRGVATRLQALALSSLFIAACGSTANDPTGAIAVTVKPGDTGTCDTSPCQVSLVMPAGSGSYEVTANEERVGEFPAGQTVSLGGYYSSQAFKIKGANVPPAYVYIPQEP
jgi:hypothetical protein